MYVFYREKGYSMVIKVIIISEDSSNRDLRKELFHPVPQPGIESIDQGKIYLQRFFKYKHKIAHIIYIFYKNEYWNNKHGTAQYNINELNITATEIYVWKKFPVSCT